MKEQGWSVLHIAASKCLVDVIKLLIDLTPEIDLFLEDKVKMML